MLAQQLQAARVEAGRTQSDAARLLGCTAQAVSNWERGYTRIDCVSLFRLLADYGTDLYRFLEKCGADVNRPGPDGVSRLDGKLAAVCGDMTPAEQEKLYRIACVLADREEAAEPAPGSAGETARVIPLYRYLAAAGYPSPQPGEDYEDYRVPAGSRADFAARIAGDSMEPWIHDGDVVLAQRRVDLAAGDVGIFYVEGGMVCKQFCQDSEGNVYLFSLNRARKAADVTIPHSSDLPLLCYGRVLLSRRIPLPSD